MVPNMGPRNESTPSNNLLGKLPRIDPNHLHFLRRSHGFTFLEVITVFVLLGIFFVIMVAYYTTKSDSELIAQSQVLKSHIRYAQSRAMNTNTGWGIRFHATQQEYWLFESPGTEDRIALPGQTELSVDLGDLGIDITGSTFNLTFDGWGRPQLSDRTFSNGQLILNLNRDGTNGDDVIVTENTGFVP